MEETNNFVAEGNRDTFPFVMERFRVNDIIFSFSSNYIGILPEYLFVSNWERVCQLNSSYAESDKKIMSRLKK